MNVGQDILIVLQVEGPCLLKIGIFSLNSAVSHRKNGLDSISVISYIYSGRQTFAQFQFSFFSGLLANPSQSMPTGLPTNSSSIPTGGMMQSQNMPVGGMLQSQIQSITMFQTQTQQVFPNMSYQAGSMNSLGMNNNAGLNPSLPTGSVLQPQASNNMLVPTISQSNNTPSTLDDFNGLLL